MAYISVLNGVFKFIKGNDWLKSESGTSESYLQAEYLGTFLAQPFLKVVLHLE